MNWNKALSLINQHVIVGVHLDRNSQYRYILEGPKYSCHGRIYNYAGEKGYKVQIGANNYIEIPFTMLEAIYSATTLNNGIYDKNIIFNIYPRQANSKTGHGCYVHVVGKIFVLAGIMKQDSPRQYSIK
jgi:hypothetical protein